MIRVFFPFSFFLFFLFACFSSSVQAEIKLPDWDVTLLNEIYELLDAPEEIKDIKKINGGFANHLWLVETANGKYVMRSPRKSESPTVFDRSLKISQKAFECGLAPRIVGLDVNKQQTLIEYVVTDPWPAYSEKAEPYLDTMAVLKAFHTCIRINLSCCLGIPFSSIFTDCEKLFSNECVPKHFFVAYNRCQRIFIALREWLILHSVVCHGDFHSGNVLLKQGKDKCEPLLIDFDTAAWGHPFFDVAKFSVSLDLASRLELLTAYLGKEFSITDRAHFDLMDLSLLMVVAIVRYNHFLDKLNSFESYLTKEEVEILLDNPASLPSFTTISFGYQSAKMRQLGAIYALGEFLRRTEGEAFESVLYLVQME